MSEQPLITPPSGPIPWVSELLTRLPAHTFMAGLFVYFILVIQPGRETWYWSVIEAQRKETQVLRQQDQDRHILQLSILEKECHSMIETDYALSQKNFELLKNLYVFIEKECVCQNP